MRSAVALGLLVLAGCERKAQAPEVVTVDLPVPTDSAVPPPPPPIPPGSPSPAAPAATRPAVTENFQALGTEPFWSIMVRGRTLTYSSPENLKGTAFPATLRLDGPRQVWSGKLEGKLVTLTIEPGTCSDGMSDTVYPYKSTFAWGERTERGCARVR